MYRQAPSDRPTFQPYWGKLTVRNDREGRGNVGIIRSPIRASTLPDRREPLIKQIVLHYAASKRQRSQTRSTISLQSLVGKSDHLGPGLLSVVRFR